MQTWFYTLLFLLFAACQRESGSPQPDINSYFPVQEGIQSEFDVVRTSYNLLSPPQTANYVVRCRIGTPITDQQSQTIYPVSYATFSKSVWRVDSVNTLWYTIDRIMGSENGQTIVKLSAPLEERNFWNGNAYNKSGDQSFRVVDVGFARQVGTFSFSKTVTVVRQNDSTLLSRKKYIETYAEGIGLVRREIQMHNYCYSTDCKGKGVIQEGITEVSTLKSYGK